MSGLPEAFKVFTDNYYTSPYLYKALYEKNTTAVELYELIENFSSDLVITNNMEVSTGNIEYRSNGSLLAMAWYDRRNIYFLTTMH